MRLPRAVFVLTATLAAILLTQFGGGVAQASISRRMLGVFVQSGGVIPPCEFSSAELDATLHSLPPDVVQYGPGLLDAIRNALASRAAGACSAGPKTTPIAAPGSDRVGSPPVPAGPATAASGAALPAPLVILGILAVLLALTGTVVTATRFGGWDPRWAATLAHAWGEAGYRTSGAVAAVLDRARRGAAGRPAVAEAVAAPTPVAPVSTPAAPVAQPPAVSPKPSEPAPASGGRRRRTVLPVALLALGATVVLTALAVSGGSSAPPLADSQQSVLQDDNHLLYTTSPAVDRTLALLAGLGVDRVRVTVKWSQLAPAPTLRTRPSFDATDPAAYPPAAWVIYDRIVRLARSRGIAVDFNVTAPGPLWAMARAPTARAADHYAPSSRELGLFVAALGRRYSGTYVPTALEQGAAAATGGYPTAGPVPRVTDWSIWNEPNQPGWLAPQWRRTTVGEVVNSPRLYREYVNEAVAALEATGHSPGRDSIVIGELAPGGIHRASPYTPMTPLQFVRALYCVDSGLRPLTGTQATALGCPPRVDRRAFVFNHLGLFEASGFGHHPYDLFNNPASVPHDPDVVTLSTLARLTGSLDRIFRIYGVQRQMPLFITEYGYQTNPPDPYQVFSPAQQAEFIDQAAYMAWRNRRVRTFAQFLLYDADPDPRYPRTSFKYWATFQTGLLFADGRRKPAFAAYRLPIWLPSRHADGSGHVLIWGQVRPRTGGRARRIGIDWRPTGGSFRAIATTTVTGREGYFTLRVRLPGTGQLRTAWHLPGAHAMHSRTVEVTTG